MAPGSQKDDHDTKQKYIEEARRVQKAYQKTRPIAEADKERIQAPTAEDERDRDEIDKTEYYDPERNDPAYGEKYHHRETKQDIDDQIIVSDP